MMKQILVSQNHNLTNLFELPAISASYPPSKQFNWLNSCDFSMVLVHVFIDFVISETIGSTQVLEG